METSKRTGYLKLVLAFVLGVALTLSFTGAAGTLYMGSAASAGACTLCSIKTDIGNMRGGTSATWTLDALALHDTANTTWTNLTVLESVIGRNATGDYSTWTLQALGDRQDLFYALTEDNIYNVIGQNSSGGLSSWTLDGLAQQIANSCR